MCLYHKSFFHATSSLLSVGQFHRKKEKQETCALYIITLPARPLPIIRQPTPFEKGVAVSGTEFILALIKGFATGYSKMCRHKSFSWSMYKVDVQ